MASQIFFLANFPHFHSHSQLHFQKFKPLSNFQSFVKPPLQIHKNFLKPSLILQSERVVKCSNQNSWNSDFFNAFVEGVKENMYLETHTQDLKYQHWKYLAQMSLSSLQVSYEDNEESSSFYICFTPLHINKLLMTSKGFIYFTKEDVKKASYFDIILEKKIELQDKKWSISKRIFEKARCLKGQMQNIRDKYSNDVGAKDVLKSQIAVAIYLIDKLAFRVGYEKDEDFVQIGCCKLKVGDVECLSPNKIKFEFLGKDSIQFEYTAEVAPPICKAIRQLQAGKSKTYDLFPDLSTTKLMQHLNELVPGLTPKLFRVYNASITLDAMLSQEIRGDVNQKILVYQQANKEVAIICNHKLTVSKSHDAQIKNLAGKLEKLREGLKELKTNLERAEEGKPPLSSSNGKKSGNLDPKEWEKKIEQQNAKIKKMERYLHSKEKLETEVLDTSKINYMDPRITFAWCKRHGVPIEKIFNKSLLAKFAWARDAEPDFRF